jgi:hypothetical protein
LQLEKVGLIRARVLVVRCLQCLEQGLARGTRNNNPKEKKRRQWETKALMRGKVALERKGALTTWSV